MEIRLDKCSTIGMVKKDSTYIQILSNSSIDNAPVPHTVMGGEFRYLGHVFTFDMDNKQAKLDIANKLTKMLIITTELKIRASIKLKILSHYIHSQIIFDLKTYDLPLTWVNQTLDALCTSHIRTWLELPVSACVTEALQLPANKGGCGLVTFKHLAEKRHTLRASHHCDMRQV